MQFPIEYRDDLVLHAPVYQRLERDGLVVFLDPESPHWIATDSRGAEILHLIDGQRTIGEITRLVADQQGLSLTEALVHTKNFLRDGCRAKFLAPEPLHQNVYLERSDYLPLERLEELWIHTNNSCNLACSHCLVSSSPEGDPGLDTPTIKDMIDQGVALGVERFYFTGGEPFVRKDIFELLTYVIERYQKDLVVLTNAILLRGKRLKLLRDLSPERLRLQVSLDGSNPTINDPIRGANTFPKILEGITGLVESGFAPIVTTAVTRRNVHDLPKVTDLLAGLGVEIQHLLWLHRRGRAALSSDDFVSNEELVSALRRVKECAARHGIRIDNVESIERRLDDPPGTQYDLGNACYSSLCIYSDGMVYPSAATAGHLPLACGDMARQSLESIWRKSPVCERFRDASVLKKPQCHTCSLRFICGGGDLEHGYFFSLNGSEDVGNPLGDDPYCDLYINMIHDAIFERARAAREQFNQHSGYRSPTIYAAMGDRGVVCGDHLEELEQSVRTKPSNCFLSHDLSASRQAVQEFYTDAAEEPKEGLCCPTRYPEEETDHIPQQVLERFYGCGSPITLAGVEEGETVVDLGSGGGIDCFIAAKKVGPEGRVVGIDMTDRMLEIARQNGRAVAERLGYEVVEFQKGYLEQIPLPDRTVDLITSNCVINLSPEKTTVFAEMWRILRDHGRIVVSDIVTEAELPPRLRVKKELWGACMGGALTEDQFLASLEQVGFYGIHILNKVFWEELEGHRFHSLTVRGYKFEKSEGCLYRGQNAIYHGPYKAVIDDEGHLFPRDEAVEVCTDTAAKLLASPYRTQFTILDASGAEEYTCCSADDTEPCC